MKTKQRTRQNKAFTIIELVLIIIVVALLFVVFISKTDNTTDKSKVAGVQADFRSFYTAVKSAGLESQLYLLSDEEFEKKLNDNLDISLQFTDGISAEEDPWGENYVYKTDRDKETQTFYVMFASKGGSDRIQLKLEDVVKAAETDEFFEEYKITMGLKQVQTIFSGLDLEIPEELEQSKQLHEDINFAYGEHAGNTHLEVGLKFGQKYAYSQGGCKTEIVFYRDGSLAAYANNKILFQDAEDSYEYKYNNDGSTTINALDGSAYTYFAKCSADGKVIVDINNDLCYLEGNEIEYSLKFDKVYRGVIDGVETEYVFNRDGSLVITRDNDLVEAVPEKTYTYVQTSTGTRIVTVDSEFYQTDVWLVDEEGVTIIPIGSNERLYLVQ